MSTANFRDIEHDLPLYILDTSELDEYDTADAYSELNKLMDELADDLYIFTVYARSGYYTDLQLYACVLLGGYEYSAHELECLDDDDIYYLTKWSSKEEFMEAYELERQKVYGAFESIAADYGLRHIRRIGTFSNGSALYEEVKDNV